MMIAAPRVYVHTQKWAGSLMGWAVQWAVVGKGQRSRARLGIRRMLDRRTGVKWVLARLANGGGAWTEGK